jgi:hypothetical protein
VDLEFEVVGWWEQPGRGSLELRGILTFSVFLGFEPVGWDEPWGWLSFELRGILTFELFLGFDFRAETGRLYIWSVLSWESSVCQ